jgi:hypothetical protein
MSNVVEFPDLAPAQGYSEAYVEKLHAEAFRDLESRISDCETMADIAMQLVQPLLCGLEPGHERAFFAVIQSHRLLARLRVDYQAMWHGENRGGLHTSSV